MKLTKITELVQKLEQDLEDARNGKLDLKSLKEFSNATGKIIKGNVEQHKYNMDKKYNDRKVDAFE